ncbi:MAG: hypothetical protein WB439_10310 [Acidobacteriaceae bacterium]
MDFSSPLALRLLLLFPIAMVGVLLTFYGQTRRGIVFGVPVSPDFARSHIARASLRNYRLQVLAVVFADLLISALLAWTPTRLLSPRILVALFAVPAELLGAWFLWRYHSRLVAPHASIAPLDHDPELVPPSTTLPLIATLLSLTPLALTALFLHLHFDQLPLRWPIHWTLDGVATGWSTRTLPGVFGPIVIGAAIILLFFGTSLFMARTSAPQSLQRRRALAPFAALSWLIAVLFCFIGLLPITHAAPDRLMLIIAIYLALALGITLWLLHRSGLTSRPTELPHHSAPDAGSHSGVHHYSSYDSYDGAVLVPHHHSFGWTLNLSRTASWIYLSAILLFVLALVVLIK